MIKKSKQNRKEKGRTAYLSLKQNPNKLFTLLILLLPVQLSLHFWPSFALVYGIRVDYLSPSIYLTDIILFFLFTIFVIESFKIKNSFQISNLKPKIIILGFILANLLASKSPLVSTFRWLKVGEFSFLAFYVYKNKPQILNILPFCLSISAIYVSFIAMLQFILKRTVGGLFYYLGERTFSISTPGIAKFEIGGREFLRPYSIFPHPNVLAAFLSASILLLLFQNKKNALNWLSIFISIPVLFLSFSQNSLFALVVCLIIYYFKDKLDLQKLIYYIFPSLVLFSFLLPLSAYYMPHATNLQDSLLKRVELSNAAILMFKNSPMFGVGLGNFIVNLPEILLSNPHIFLSSTIWWLQPVHNIYLLVLSETGLIGFFIFSLLLKNLFKSSPRPDSYILLIFILLTGFLDHYWLTLQQSFLLLAIIFGLAIL